MENRWFKNAVIYCVDVDTFRDGNGDGIGVLLGCDRR
jgi:maltose alpha-D-glucosyltransferase / alpha-amylase